MDETALVIYCIICIWNGASRSRQLVLCTQTGRQVKASWRHIDGLVGMRWSRSRLSACLQTTNKRVPLSHTTCRTHNRTNWRVGIRRSIISSHHMSVYSHNRKPPHGGCVCYIKARGSKGMRRSRNRSSTGEHQQAYQDLQQALKLRPSF